MRLPALLGRLFRSKAAVTPLSMSDGWPLVIREPYAGAFQQHVVADGPRDLLAFSAVYACITRIASDIAKLRPMIVADNLDGTCTEIKGESPFKAMLERPNTYQNTGQFLKQWITSKLSAGNTYVLKERDARGMVRAQHILDPRRVKPLVTASGDVYYELAADNLAGLLENVVVPASEIMHDRVCPLWHPLVGISPLYACALSATLGNRIQKNSTSFFQNMSQAGGYLIAPGKLEAEDAARMAREWRENFTGANAGRVAVLANGLKYESNKPIVPDEAQLVDQLKWTVEDVARCFFMPAYKIGGALPANTTVEALNQAYYSECLQVHIEDLEAVWRTGLGLARDAHVELDLDGLLRMDRTALIKAEAEGVKAGIFMPDESRLRLNLPPVPGGDAVYLQQQNYSLAALAKRDAKPDPFEKGEPAPRSEPAEPANDDEVDIAAAAGPLMLKHLEIA